MLATARRVKRVIVIRLIFFAFLLPLGCGQLSESTTDGCGRLAKNITESRRSCVLALNEVAVHLRYPTSSVGPGSRVPTNRRRENSGRLATFNVTEALHSRVWMWITSAQDSAVRAE